MKSLAIIFICLPIICLGQIDLKLTDSGEAYFEKVIEIKGQSKDELYSKGKEWLFRTYVSGKAVLEIDDKENGKIMGNGITQELVYNNMGIKKDGGSFEYKISILFKDGRSKIKIDGIRYRKGEMVGLNEPAFYAEEYPASWIKFGKKQIGKKWIEMKEQAKEEFEVIFKRYEKYLNQGSEEDDNW